MKRKRLWQISVLMVLVALLTCTIASAAPSVDRKADVFPPEYRQPGSGGARPPAQSLSAAGGGSVNAQAIALGKPGTTFRYDKTIGVSTVGYLEDDKHINGVTGIATDPDGNVYTVEENGARLMKLDSSGHKLWQAGGNAFHDWGTNGLNWPRELFYLEGMVVVADADNASMFNSDTGELMGRFPPEPWTAPDEFRFYQMRGITVDELIPPNTHIYAADQDRHRIVVYLLTQYGPAYQATIGVTDEPGDDNNHFNRPSQVEIIGNNLYVADTGNARVQKCEPNDNYTVWTCETFHGGVWGSGEDELQYVYGLGDDGLGNLYITDNGNGRVLKCPTDGSGDCGMYTEGLWWPTDIAFRPNGNALISVYDDFTIREFTPAGAQVGIYKGTAGVPYLTDDQHYNLPTGVDVDVKGNVYITEQGGARLTKLSPAGEVLKQFGVPGMPWGDPKTYLENGRALAVDKTGKKLYVVGGSKVHIYDTATLTYLSTFHENDADDHYVFYDASGIAFDASGNFYIVDRGRQRVMMYNKLGVFVRQLGITDEPGMANDHFAWPAGVGTDKTGNVYVADQQNCRVQKFSKTGLFLATIGTGVCGDQFDRMGGPSSVMVDSKGNIYVAEEWSNRVNVYDKYGAYLTSIAGQWGHATGRMRNPTDLALDSKGSLYVADQNNNRVQKFLPGVPYAAQVSLNGFGTKQNVGVSSVAMFKGQLYAGTATNLGSGAQIWRMNKTGWEKVISDGFENSNNSNISSLMEYKGYLYAGTFNCSGDNCNLPTGGQLWRSQDGLTWMPVTFNGFGKPHNTEILHLQKMAAGGGKICAQTADWFTGSGAEIYCSVSGDPGTWDALAADGFGNGSNMAFGGWLEYNGALYTGTANTATGGQVWRYTTSGDWEQVNEDGFGDGGNSFIRTITLYKGYVYVGTENDEGPELWRCKDCDGADWVQVGAIGLGTPASVSIDALRVSKNVLYAFTRAYVKMPTDEGIEKVDIVGMEIYKSIDGVNWSKVGNTGLGSNLNVGPFWDNGITMLTNGDFYLGMYNYDNQVNGGAVWKFCPLRSACK